FAAVLMWFGRKNGARRRWAAVWPLVFSLPFLLFGSGTPLSLDTTVLFGLCVMSVYHTFETPRRNLSDPVRGLFGRPFGHLATGAEALVRRPVDSTPRRKWRPVVWGLLIALPLTLIGGALLISADAAFSALADRLLQPFARWRVEWPLVILRLMLSAPVGMYLFAAFYGNTHPKAAEWSDEQWQEKRQSLRQMPGTVLLTAGIPLCLLYLLFFLSQSAYYFSAFSGLLPADFTYAEYAREGFFQLCAVAVINLVVLVAIRLFCQRETEALPHSLKIYSAVLCGFTLLLIATALRKMFLYIEQYGLTPLRVYTSWFMVLLAVVFVVLTISQFWPRVKPWRILTVTFLAMFAVLQFSNVNGWIARYNVEQYKAGQLKTVDVSLFYELGDAAVPYAAELLGDSYVGHEARRFLKDREAKWEQYDSWVTFNFTTYQAKEVVENL
ncbi:MAG: DUF4173 domain-containing protein, partial [Clostridia bacterium]|nr:DUF4173 domain-containing protein [Clostridia bacterium]